MARDAEATRKRLLTAALDEFAAYGIAGARVDRIAAAAQSNKAQIYHYFGSKDGLFDAVFNEICVRSVSENPIDTADLPGYAARIFDGYEARPEVPRLVTWYRLERPGSRDPLEIVVASLRAKTDAIARAQAAGELPSRFTAPELLGLIMHMASLWITATPEYDPLVADVSRARRRQVVVDAVTALLAA
ncbi:TetR family transcriptional regulator [Actinacidiphila alni]|uniref:TetR family transcriptional regulator n=1 Tax=Actinacidiphila alni TaxID=380248 RepID=UPI0033F433C1